MEFTGNIFGYASSVVRTHHLPHADCRSSKPQFQWIDYFCSFIDSDLAWRIPLFVQVVIGAILAAGSLVMPESPRSGSSLVVMIVSKVYDYFEDGLLMSTGMRRVCKLFQTCTAGIPKICSPRQSSRKSRTGSFTRYAVSPRIYLPLTLL